MRRHIRPLTFVFAWAWMVSPLDGQSAQREGLAQSLETEQLDPLRFRSIGPANMSGRLVDIAVVESDTRVFYLASATGGAPSTGG